MKGVPFLFTMQIILTRRIGLNSALVNTIET